MIKKCIGATVNEAHCLENPEAPRVLGVLQWFRSQKAEQSNLADSLPDEWVWPMVQEVNKQECLSFFVHVHHGCS